MSVIKENGTDLYKALKSEGFILPDNCGDVELVMPVDGLMQVRYTVIVYGEQLAQLGRALAKLGEAQK